MRVGLPRETPCPKSNTRSELNTDPEIDVRSSGVTNLREMEHSAPHTPAVASDRTIRPDNLQALRRLD